MSALNQEALMRGWITTFGFIPLQTNPHVISGGTQGLNN